MTLDPALLAPVLEQPDAVSPRLVLADRLSEQGDPRGEFIGLHCLSPPTERQRRRAMALLRTHWQKWVGSPLSLLMDARTIRFENGFLHSCSLRRSPSWLQNEAVVLPEHALMRRVEVVRDFVPDEQSLTELLPRFRGLRAAHGLDPEELESVLMEPPPLVELGLAQLDRTAVSTLLSAELPGLEFLAIEARNRVALILSLVARFDALRRVRVGRGELRTWRSALLETPLAAVEVRVRGWLLTLSGPRLRRLDAWPVAELRDDATRPLADELSSLEIGDLEYIHVRGGRTPTTESVKLLKRAAKGVPIRLPRNWRRDSPEDD